MNSSRRDLVPESSSSHLRRREYCHKKNKIDKQDQKQQHFQQQQCFSSNLIQSNSIQNQFTILSNQRDKFIHDRVEAEKELEQVQKEQYHFKSEHDNLIESNLRTKEELGQKMEKLALLKEEELRLCKLIENEFHAIQDCTQHLKTLNQKNHDRTKRYIAEMDPLNSELAALLERRIQKKCERCISVRSIENVVLPELDKAFHEKNKPQLLNQKKILDESIDFLKSASEQRTRNIGLLSKLQQRIENIEDENNSSHTNLYCGPFREG